jgi:hypothetical protein
MRGSVVRTALAACALLAISMPSLWADAQAEIQARLPAGKTILTAGAKELAAAVAGAILSNTDAAITAADLAAAALQPVTETVKGKTEVKVRSDRDTSAPLVAAAAIGALLSGSDATLGADVAAITDSLAVVNGADAKQNLDAAGQAAVIKAALGAVSDAAMSDSSLLTVDQAIGQALAADTTLEHLPESGLTVILQKALLGISGATGKAQAVAPEAAEAFVAGLLSSAVPDGASLPGFAVAILAKVARNTSVDELVAYQVGLKDNEFQSNLVVLAGVLFHAYPAAAAKVTQGITAVSTAGFNNETQRIAYIQALTSAEAGDAVPVAEGAVFVDPFYAGPFTQGVFNSLLAAPKGGKLLAADAPKIAAGVGGILGQDGAALTQVADVYSQFIGSGDLPAASAASYATALIRAAVKGVTPPFTGAAAGGGGGELQTAAGITPATVNDLVSIADLLADGVITADHSTLGGKGLTKAAAEVGALAATVARFTGNELFVDPDGVSQPVAAFLAGTLADTVVELNLGAVAQDAILAAIAKDVAAITNKSVDPQVAAAVKAFGDYPEIGAITVQETTVTNL